MSVNADNHAGYVLACSVIENLHQKLGVNLLPIFMSYSLTDKEKRKKAAALLIDGIFSKAAERNESWFIEDESEFDLDSDIEIEPNISISEADALTISNYKGQDVYEYTYTLVKRFENLAVAETPEQLAFSMVKNAILSVGVPLAKAVGVELFKRVGLKKAIEVGIEHLGPKTAYAAVAVVLVALINFFFSLNPKKILGLVVNNTDSILEVKGFKTSTGDLHMRHGSMVSFMEDYADGLTSPKIQIGKREFISKGNENNMVQVGIYAADKNWGLRGAEGIMMFSPKETVPLTMFNFAHMFAVPYKHNNRTNIVRLNSRSKPKSLDVLFQELYNADKERVDFEEGTYRFTSTVNDKRGGVVACIASVHAVEKRLDTPPSA